MRRQAPKLAQKNCCPGNQAGHFFESEESLFVFDAVSVLAVDSEDEVFSAELEDVSGFFPE